MILIVVRGFTLDWDNYGFPVFVVAIMLELRILL